MLSRTQIERLIPSEDTAYDVLVAGGGPAGLGAALASARAGATTLLLEARSAFGGVASLALWMPVNRLFIDPDGTCEWVTFVLTNVDREAKVEDLEEGDPVIHLIMDGLTGLIWLQRPFYDEELDMLREHNWPPVLRTDFLRTRALTEEEGLPRFDVPADSPIIPGDRASELLAEEGVD